MSGNRTRSRPADPATRPVYARVLRLRHLNPGGLLCFLFFEGMIALGVLLALAELATWWSVPVLPATVAGMVKVNDAVAGALARSDGGNAGRRAPALPDQQRTRELSAPDPTFPKPSVPVPSAPGPSVPESSVPESSVTDQSVVKPSDPEPDVREPSATDGEDRPWNVRPQAPVYPGSFVPQPPAAWPGTNAQPVVGRAAVQPGGMATPVGSGAARHVGAVYRSGTRYEGRGTGGSGYGGPGYGGSGTLYGSAARRESDRQGTPPTEDPYAPAGQSGSFR